MRLLTLEIRAPEHEFQEIEAYLGHRRLYKKGTDRSMYLDCRDREEADLTKANLEANPGVTVRILGE